MLRRKRNIKQYDMARALGVSPSYLSKIEKDRQEPTERFKLNAAKFLKTTVEKLFNNSPVESVFTEFSTGLNNRLWARRRQLGMKQCDVAKKLNISTPFLSKIEMGLVEPNDKFRSSVSKVLKMSEKDLFLAKTE